MKIQITKSTKILPDKTLFFIERTADEIIRSAKGHVTKEEIAFLKKKLADKKTDIVAINRYGYQYFFFVLRTGNKPAYSVLEELRKTGNKLLAACEEYISSSVTLISGGLKSGEWKALLEGIALSAYKFTKFKSDKTSVLYSLNEVSVYSKHISPAQLEETQKLLDSVYICRDLVNEPVCNLNSEVFSGEIISLFKNSGAKVEILNKNKIEALQMNGLLAVNKGSTDPPAFAIIEWKPRTTKNKKPVVLVGKGILFDTGGINVKPASGMETMKCDMAGGAAVVASMHAISGAKLPAFVVGIIPVTDNRPSGNSLVPGDIITYSNKTTVEVLNSDAEGRLILADGIIYAGKYKPALIITIATLTGSAQAAIGGYGIVGMHHKASAFFRKLQQSGKEVYERVVEFPFWEEYDELIKSEIADIKNLGGPYAGAITAGKFLARFAKFPFIHLDIAGPAFNDKKDNYRGLGGSGVGVRLLFDFISRMSEGK